MSLSTGPRGAAMRSAAAGPTISRATSPTVLPLLRRRGLRRDGSTIGGVGSRGRRGGGAAAPLPPAALPLEQAGELAPLLAAGAAPIVKIGILGSVGAACAKQGLLTPDVRRALSRLVLDVLTPAFMLVKLAPHIDVAAAAQLWPLGANVAASHAAALGLGAAHLALRKRVVGGAYLRPALRRQVLAATAIGNVGSLPLVLLAGLLAGAPAAESDAVVSYVMLGWFWAMLVQMPLGHWLLHARPGDDVKDAEDTAAAAAAAAAVVTVGAFCPWPRAAAPGGEPHPQHHYSEEGALSPAYAAVVVGNIVPAPPAAALLGRVPARVLTAALVQERNWSPSSHERAHSPSPSSSSSAVDATAASTPTAVSATTTSTITTTSDDVERMLVDAWGAARELAVAVLPPEHAALPTAADVIAATLAAELDPAGTRRRALGDAWAARSSDAARALAAAAPAARAAATSPFVAGLAAIAVGSCPPARDALFTADGSLALVGESLDMLGAAFMPCLLLCLGANLADGPGRGVSDNKNNLPRGVAAGVAASRLLVLPLLGAAAVASARHAEMLPPALADNPAALALMMLTWATPSAMLVHALASMHGRGEDEVAALLFWQYAAAAGTLPLAAAGALHVAEALVDGGAVSGVA